jgi:hypothetical protein
MVTHDCVANGAMLVAYAAGMALNGGDPTSPLLHLSGLPASLYNMTQLEELHLFGTELRSGTMPADLNKLPFLQSLHLQTGPGVTGTLPNWNGMASLRELRLLLGPNITGELCYCSSPGSKRLARHTTTYSACL